MRSSVLFFEESVDQANFSGEMNKSLFLSLRTQRYELAEAICSIDCHPGDSIATRFPTEARERQSFSGLLLGGVDRTIVFPREARENRSSLRKIALSI
jgi:hypothetical protein